MCRCSALLQNQVGRRRLERQFNGRHIIWVKEWIERDGKEKFYLICIEVLSIFLWSLHDLKKFLQPKSDGWHWRSSIGQSDWADWQTLGSFGSAPYISLNLNKIHKKGYIFSEQINLPDYRNSLLRNMTQIFCWTLYGSISCYFKVPPAISSQLTVIQANTAWAEGLVRLITQILGSQQSVETRDTSDGSRSRSSWVQGQCGRPDKWTQIVSGAHQWDRWTNYKQTRI